MLSVVVWSTALLLAVALLLGLGFLVGYGAPSEPTPLAEVLQVAASTGVAIGIAVALVTLIAWCFRHVCFDWLASRPGRIEVDTFSADATLVEADVERYTLLFRRRLADLRMRAPASVPGAGAEGEFLEVLGRGGVDSRNWLGSALSLLRAAKPRHAWQVTGVLVARRRSPSCGLTVQVERLPDQGNPPETFWADSWEEAVKRGADHATAVILPRTRRCVAPWSAWKRFAMTGELIGAYEDALLFERQRRYDEALEAYYRASGMDPLNMTLRLQVGHLQEKLELYLDALGTYQGMIELDERLSGRTVRMRREARAEHTRAILVARYRRMVLLGGDELPDQWRKASATDKPNDRDLRRTALRERLERQLAPLVEEGLDSKRGRQRAGTTDAKTLMKEPALGSGDGAKTDEERTLKLERRELFALAALADAGPVRWRSQRQRRDGRQVLSPDSVRLTKLCIRVRLESIQWDLRHRDRQESWQPDVDWLTRKVERIETRGAGFHRWHEHYTAACAYALPLLVIPRDKPHHELREALVEKSIERLAKAAALTDSAYFVGRRDWLLSEDPDLDGLRTDPLFKDFEAICFPADRPTSKRPRHVKKLQNARHIRDLLIATAERWEKVWHLRWEGLERRVDIHAAVVWWNDESRAWELVDDVSRNYRHWYSRWKLVEAMRKWAVQYDLEPLVVPFPRYEDDPFDDKALENPRAAMDAAVQLGERFGSIAEHVPDTPSLTDVHGWKWTLGKFDAEGREPRRFLLAVLCDHHASLWQRLREWLEADGDAEVETAAKAFERQVADTLKLWRHLDSWWRRPRIVRASSRSALYRRRGVHNGDGHLPSKLRVD